jgi:WD40 repeat protein
VHKIVVSNPKVVLKLEAVSSRLKRSLVHPNKEAVLYGLNYSPDGHRIIAGDYPGGVIQIWDVESGRQLTKIETGYGYRGSATYFFLDPNWKRAFVSTQKRKITRIEKDGEKLVRWEFDGSVRVWDLETGGLLSRFQHKPPRGIFAMTLSPNAAHFMTGDDLPGEYEGRAPRAMSLWNVATARQRDLGDNLDPYGLFSPDGQTVALCHHKDDYTNKIIMFDVATGKERKSIPISEPFASVTIEAFVEEGRTLLGRVRVFPSKGDWNNSQSYLRFWDVASGREIASIKADEKDATFSWPAVFSPDRKRLTLGGWKGSRAKLYIIDTMHHEAATIVDLGAKAFVRTPAFSPDGKWIAVVTHVVPDEVARLDPSHADLAQPRIHLVEAATGTVLETIVGPQAFTTCVCFSPNGKTLASGGNGKVMLWDLSQPLGLIDK